MFCKPTFTLIALGFLFLPNIAVAVDEEFSLGASSVWSSWYWPSLDTKNPNMYDDGECMARYDSFDLPGSDEQSSQAWEADPGNHGDYPGVEEWQGHCHAWAAAAIWESQPVTSETHSGVEFRIRDKKGLLTELYIGALKAENLSIFKDYPTPGYLWKIMRNEIQKLAPKDGKGMPVILDLSPYESEQWNYPVFRYKVQYSGVSPNISGTMWFYFARDESANYADETTVTWAYTDPGYTFTGVSTTTDGNINENSGSWTNNRQPWRVWRPKAKTDACQNLDGYSCMSGNPHLQTEYLKVILDQCTATEVIIDGTAAMPGTGSLVHPFRTVEEGISEVCTGGTLTVITGTYNEKLAFTKKLLIKNAGGPVTIRGI